MFFGPMLGLVALGLWGIWQDSKRAVGVIVWVVVAVLLLVWGSR